jgi:superfamily II DNA/RNA helicase
MSLLQCDRQARKTDAQLNYFQLSATPTVAQMKPGYLGDTVYIAQLPAEQALRNGYVRQVNYQPLRYDKALSESSEKMVEKVMLHCRVMQSSIATPRIICYVSTAKLADDCLSYLKEHYPEVVPAAYHSGLLDAKLDAIMKTFETENGHTRIIFAVDMLKTSTDIEGGVDRLYYFKRKLSIEDRIQILGRAFREAHEDNANKPAMFSDYSDKDNISVRALIPSYNPGPDTPYGGMARFYTHRLGELLAEFEELRAPDHSEL